MVWVEQPGITAPTLAHFNLPPSLPSSQRSHPGCWAQAGMCFGLSGTSCRVGFVAASSTTVLAAPLGLAGSLLLSSLGFVLQTVGLKDGHTLIVCTCAAVASISTGALKTQLKS